MFQATRRRLALWYAAVTAIVLLFFASGVYLYVRTTLVERVDDTLNHVIEVVQRSLVIEPAADIEERVLTAVGVVEPPVRVNIEASFRDNAQAVEDDHIDLEWFSATGEPLWSTLIEPFDLPLKVNPAGETIYINDEQVMRQVTQRIVVGHQVLGYLRVSHPWFEVTKPSRQLVLDLAVGTSLMVIAVASVGWLLSGIAITPVRDSYQQLKQFTADASHELRNPIAVIQTNVQVALADPEPDAVIQQQQLRVIERLTRRLGRLVDDLLFLARQESGLAPLTYSSVNVAQLLTEVIEEQSTVAEEQKIDLTSQIYRASIFSSDFVHTTKIAGAEPDWNITAEADQLTRLFTNLISNALQYTPAKGKVTVSMERDRLHNQEAVRVEVQDTGIGIPTEDLPNLFDRFYRVDPTRQRSGSSGSGLGLAIAKVIVNNHQGSIQINSVPHQGTTVTVFLPA